MRVISSREFRDNQKLYFDLADQNEQVVVQRGKDKSYMLTPITESGRLSTNPALIERIRAGGLSNRGGHDRGAWLPSQRFGGFVSGNSSCRYRLLGCLCLSGRKGSYNFSRRFADWHIGGSTAFQLRKAIEQARSVDRILECFS